MIGSPSSRADCLEASLNHLRRIVRALELYSREVEATHGLTAPQRWALWALAKGGPMALKDLAATMHLDPSTVVGVVDRLEAKGLVTRGKDAVDRRRVRLSLTVKGRALEKKAPHPAQDRLIEGLSSLRLDRLRHLERSLAFLVGTMEAEDLEARAFFGD
jgi:DNA-binding MarR family transcriptional regulator